MGIEDLLDRGWTSFVHRYLRRPVVASVVGSAVAVSVAAALVPLRDWLGNTNVALLLIVVVVVAAGIGGRVAGAITAIAASQAFNVFHTEPYGELFIERREDIISTVLVAAVGIAVGELTNLRVRSARRARRRDYGVQRVHHVSVLVQRGAEFDDVLEAVQSELSSELGLSEVVYGTGPRPPGPTLALNGTIENPAEPSPMHVGRTGVLVDVTSGDRRLGWLRLVPRRPADYEPASLQIAVVLAELLARAGASR